MTVLYFEGIVQGMYTEIYCRGIFTEDSPHYFIICCSEAVPNCSGSVPGSLLQVTIVLPDNVAHNSARHREKITTLYRGGEVQSVRC